MSTPQYDIANVQRRAEKLDISTQFQPYSGVEIITGEQDDDGVDVIYTAGDSSGRVLTIKNPWGSKVQAQNILNQIRGFTYQPYDAESALVDPSAEIGDGISVNDVYSGIYIMNREFTPLMEADVSAPQSEELDHEYPYEPNETRSIERKFSAMESELRMTNREISAKVSEDGGSASSFGWSLKAGGFTLTSKNKVVFKCTSSGVEVSGKITATSGEIGGFTIGSKAITYNGIDMSTTNKSGVYLGQSGIRINGSGSAYFRASSSGDVEANNMLLKGNLYFGNKSTYLSASSVASLLKTVNSKNSTWTTGAGYGANWNSAKNGYGAANDIWAGSFHSSGTSYFAYISTYTITHYGTGRVYRPATININGTNYSIFACIV